MEIVNKLNENNETIPFKIKYKVKFKQTRSNFQVNNRLYTRKRITYSRDKTNPKEIKKKIFYYKEKSEKRARSTGEKQEQFQKIIQAGKELFIEKGSSGFGMRALARSLKMSEGNLYNYVKSKRELWIAIRSQYFREFNDGLRKVINSTRGKISYIELLLKIGEYYLNFSTEDYKRFRMMNTIPAPKSNKIGPIERSYQPFNSIKIIESVVEEAMDAGEINQCDTEKLTYYLFGMMYGAVNVERELELRDPIREPIIMGNKILSKKEYREFLFQELRKIITSSTWS